jgi:hypothetical protein
VALLNGVIVILLNFRAALCPYEGIQSCKRKDVKEEEDEEERKKGISRNR